MAQKTEPRNSSIDFIGLLLTCRCYGRVKIFLSGAIVEVGLTGCSSPSHASAAGYVNFMTEEEGNRVAAAYGSNYDRLVQIKRRYDPENVFHLNQNITMIRRRSDIAV
jgi:Berberine and berberine like